MQADYQAILSAPFGRLGILTREGVLCGIDFLPAGSPVQPAHDRATREICAALERCLSQPDAPFPLPLAVRGTPFQQRVWDALRAIPCGSTLTYGELAARVGSGPRAVANACGANPVPLIIPCHRVVARHGLGGFMGGRSPSALAIKQWLLQHERSRSGAA